MRIFKKAFVFILAIVVILCMVSNINADEPQTYGAVTETTGEIIVNGVEIAAPRPSITGGVIMLPLRSIMTELGFDLYWDGNEKRIVVGNNYVLWIGKAQFSSDGGQTIREFGPAPELIDERTFVPISLFNFGFAGYSASIKEGKVVIETVYETKNGEVESVVLWGGVDWVVSTWYDEGFGPNYLIMPEEREEIRIHNRSDEDVFALLRVTLGAEFFADEIKSARLHLKPQGEIASTLRLTYINSIWSPNMTILSEALALIDEGSFVLVDVIKEVNGWISLDITYFVISWINGDIRNNGLAIFGVDGYELSVFCVYGDNTPFIRVNGTVGTRYLGYARHSFVRVPWKGMDNPLDAGNCLSFALRDINMINLAHLNSTYEEIDYIYRSEGISAVTEHIADLVEQYVADNAEALQISGFRRIESFDSPINPALEYRIALRVGVDVSPNIPITEHGGFDYHFWVQIDDGRWAQKFPIGYSEIVVGSGAGIDPGRYYWHMVSDEYWGWFYNMDFYTSNIIYFAVTKDTEEFTAHMESSYYGLMCY